MTDGQFGFQPIRFESCGSRIDPEVTASSGIDEGWDSGITTHLDDIGDEEFCADSFGVIGDQHGGE